MKRNHDKPFPIAQSPDHRVSDLASGGMGALSLVSIMASEADPPSKKYAPRKRRRYLYNILTLSNSFTDILKLNP